MKKEEILKKINKANKVKSNTLPILSYSLIKDGQMTTSDLNVYLVQKVEFKGAFLVHTAKLKKIVSAAPKMADIDIEQCNEGAKVTVNNKRSYTLKCGIPVSEFPDTPETTKKIGTISKDALLNVAAFRGNDDLRPAMSGVYVENNRLTATNAHILTSRMVKTIEGVTEPFIIYAERFDLIDKGHESNLSISTHGDKCKWTKLTLNKFDYMVTLNIDANYPNYKGVIPEAWNNESSLEADAIVTELKAALVVADKDSPKVSLGFKKDEISVSCTNSEQDTMSGRVDCSFFGEDNTVDFDPNYLIKCIELSDAPLEISFNEVNRIVKVGRNNYLMPLLKF